MRLKLTRIDKLENSTIGKLYVDYGNGRGYQYFCDTLEDVERDVKIQDQTAIPKGVYRCINTFSNRFQRITPLVQNVKGFTHIRIHSGNTDKDTSGCILVGIKSGSGLINSIITYNKLWNILKYQKQGYDLEIV